MNPTRVGVMQVGQVRLRLVGRGEDATGNAVVNEGVLAAAASVGVGVVLVRWITPHPLPPVDKIYFIKSDGTTYVIKAGD